MCKKMYNDLCEICQNAADCTVDYDGITLDAITRKVVDCKDFKVVPKIKIKCTYECKELVKSQLLKKRCTSCLICPGKIRNRNQRKRQAPSKSRRLMKSMHIVQKRVTTMLMRMPS